MKKEMILFIFILGFIALTLPSVEADAYNITNATFVDATAAGDATPENIAFSNDGTKLFIIGNGNDVIIERSLSTAYDVSTNFSTVSKTNGQDLTSQGIAFNNDGTKLFMSGAGNGGDLYEYDLSPAFNLSSLAFNTSIDVSAQDTLPGGISFNNNGTKLFMIGRTLDLVFEFDVSPAYNITSITYVQNFSVTTEETTPRGIAFKPDGTKMFIVGSNADTVFEYTLSTAFNVSTASLTNNRSVLTEDNNPRGIAFNGVGSKMFISGNQGNDVNEYSIFVLDSIAPATVTNLANQTVTGSSIYWNWTNPIDGDLDHVEIWLDSVFTANVSSPTNFYNATGLSSNTTYNIGTRTVDASGNINTTFVNDTATTLFVPDTTPPATVTNLDNQTITDRSILWNWTNPSDSDFNYTEVWLDGVFTANVSDPDNSYTATGLNPSTQYEIGTRTVDASGNINTTFVNDTATTVADTFPPATITSLGEQSTTDTWIYWTWTNPSDSDFNYTEVWLDSSFVANVSGPDNFYNATGLSSSTAYNIGTRTVDASGNINTTFVNDTATTLSEQDTLRTLFKIINRITQQVVSSVDSTGSAFFVGDVNITGTYYGDGSGLTNISGDSINPNSINTTHIVDGTIQTSDLANGGVTNPKIASDAVNTTQIVDGTILSEDLASASVTNSKISTNAINSSQIIDSTITDSDISDSTNLTLGEKIVFTLGAVIQNVISGQVDVNGTLNISDDLLVVGDVNVTGNINASGNITADVFFGDGSQLTGISGGIWTNVSGTATYDGDANITGALYLQNTTPTTNTSSLYNREGTLYWQNKSVNTEFEITRAVNIIAGTGYNISSAVFVQNFSIEDTSTQGLNFNNDGTKMYVAGNTGDDINEYNLSDAFNISTAIYVQNLDVGLASGGDNSPVDIEFNLDGTKMYILGKDSDIVHEYNLTNAFNISSAALVQNFSVNSQDTAVTGLSFNNDGTKMFVSGSSSDKVYEYNLSDAFNVTSAALVQNFSVLSQDGNPRGLVFNPDGTKMFITGGDTDSVFEYNLSTAFNISTASIFQNFSVNAQDAQPRGLAFNTDGTKMFMSGSNSNAVHEYNITLFGGGSEEIGGSVDALYFIPESGEGKVGIGTATPTQKLDVNGSVNISGIYYGDGNGLTNISGDSINPNSINTTHIIDGTITDADISDSTNLTLGQKIVFGLGGVIQNIISGQIDVNGNLNVTGNVTADYFIGDGSQLTGINSGIWANVSGTATYGDDANLSGALYLQNTTPTTNTSALYNREGDLYWQNKIANTQFEITRVVNVTIGTGYNISSAVFVQNFSIADTSTQGLTFNNDGTKMYVVGNIGDDVNQYNLTDAYNVSSAVFIDSVGAQDNTPSDVIFNSDGTKMFVVGKDLDEINEFNLSVAFNVSSAVFVQLLSIADTGPGGIAFNTDGTKMFISGSSNNLVYEYNLSVAYNVTTATNTQNFSVSSQDGNPRGLAFNSDGTKMFIVGGDTDSIIEYNLSNAFNISSASYFQNFSVNTQDAQPRGLAFNTDGTKMFMSGSNSNAVHEYDIALAGGSSTTVSGSVDALYFIPESGEGKVGIGTSTPTQKLDVNGSANISGNIYAGDNVTADYFIGDGSLLTGIIQGIWESISGVATYDGNANITGALYLQNTTPTTNSSALYNKNGVLYWQNKSVNTQFEITRTVNVIAGTGFNISSAVFIQNFSIADTSTQGLTFNNDGTKMYVVGNTGDEVNEYNLTDAFNVSSATFVTSIGAQDPIPSDVTFNTDGTKMFVVGKDLDEINEFNLSVAFNISSAVFVQLLSITEASPGGIAFNTDGTKMFVSGSSNDLVYEYNLSVAYNVTTATNTQNFSVATQDGNPRALVFNSDGTKMFIAGGDTDSIIEYSLSDAFNISSASYFQNFSIASEDAQPRGLAFNSDGTKIYMSGSNSNAVHEYNITLFGAGSEVVSGSVDSLYFVPESGAGKVGIGTTTPTTLFHIIGNSENTSLRIGTDNASSQAKLELFTGVNSYGKVAIISEGLNSWRRGNLHFVVNTNGSESNYTLGTDTKLFISGTTGDVGIGTTTPQNTLNVIGATNSTTGFIVGANTGVTDSSSYWLCTASDCSTTCQVKIDGGIITSCT